MSDDDPRFQTMTGRAVDNTGKALFGAISQRARGHWSDFLILVLLGDHLGFWEVASFTSGEMTVADIALVLGVLGRLIAQFGPGGGTRRVSD